ncbi:MAG: gliding motility-associated C-terminal domain-containing protein [Bacteroidales bacterium]|nr:gliding motility-associated C-terminal domain-containing protein [Bacteroidales bacterium]
MRVRIRHTVLVVAFMLTMAVCYATHQRAGEISYRYVSGLTYEFTITTYTYTPSPADRPEIEVFWGDGTSTVIERSSKVNLGNDVSRNTYISEHTFSAAGTFHVTFEDPNRNAGIVNIPSSVEIPFFIETILVINPFIGGNSSPRLLNPPLDNGCVNTPYYHNPGAFDDDGDSLTFSLINCRGLDGEDIPGYSLPFASNFIEIDRVTGELVWDSPTLAGEYNVAILIEEWRNGMMVSSMVRDMQITIAPCNNRPPVVEVEDTCVVAGSRVDLLVKVSDETSKFVTLTATGEPLLLDESPAIFSQITDSVTYFTHFVWQTTCNHIKKTPYEVLFKAKDNGPQVELVSFKTLRIRVIPPAPENLNAVPEGNVIMLDWSPDRCSNAVGYDVYRRTNHDEFEPDSCQTGLPDEAGYVKVGTTNGWADTVFTNYGSVYPIYHGNIYCYRVVALFPDGSESVVSERICASIANDAPVIVNADVAVTDSAAGQVIVGWLFPPELDSIAFPPPYHFDVYRDGVPVHTVQASENQYDTLYYLDHGLNTHDSSHSYYVTISNHDTVIEKSNSAKTIFLTLVPSDRRITLFWDDVQPWNNVDYVIYRYNSHIHSWDSIATAQSRSYTDYNLVNGQEYCYHVKARGYYWIPDTIGPLFNRSQERCATPFDNEPPEMPVISVSSDCQSVEFDWVFSSDTAASDAVRYYIYYKPTPNFDFACIDSFENKQVCYPEPCSYSIAGQSSELLVGCFAMRVADSNHNRTNLSDSVCMDVFDCLEYSLPNIFTPNSDGVNDIYTPIYPYFGVYKIDIDIFDRWGKRVFRSNNPDILWDGTDETTKLPCPDGVYFYGCRLYVRTLTGETAFLLNGSITLVR